MVAARIRFFTTGCNQTHSRYQCETSQYGQHWNRFLLLGRSLERSNLGDLLFGFIGNAVVGEPKIPNRISRMPPIAIGFIFFSVSIQVKISRFPTLPFSIEHGLQVKIGASLFTGLNLSGQIPRGISPPDLKS
jgi:hypothetical protein